MSSTLNWWRAGITPQTEQPIYDWARANVSLPQSCYAIGGPFRVEKSRYLIAPFDALTDDLVREVTVVAGVQTGKSLLCDLFAAYLVATKPGPIFWNFHTNEFATEYGKVRAMPMLRKVKGITWPESRHDATRTEILFPGGWVRLQGANLTNLQAFSVPYLLNDEVWQWEPGMRAQALARATYFRWRSKVLDVSQAGEKGDDLDRAFTAGACNEWTVPCPACNRYQTQEWSVQREDGTWAGFTWDTNATTRPGGNWNFDAMKATVRYECVFCGAAIRDTPTERRRLNDLGRYEPRNPNASREHASFTWPSWACDEVSWGMLAEEYLKAKEQEEIGNMVPIRDFWQKRAARAFDPEKHAQVIHLPDTKVEPTGWPKAKFSFMTVDVQVRSLWALVQAWSEEGESMVLWAGELFTWVDLRQKQQEFKIPDECVFVDCGYRRENAANQSEVFLNCLKHGHEQGGKWLSWWALRGTDAPDFKYKVTAGPNKDKVIPLWFQWPPVDQPVDFGLKTTDAGLLEVAKWQRKHGRRAFVRVVNWATGTVRHVGKARRDRMQKGELCYKAPGVSEHFDRQMFSEQFVQRWNKQDGQSRWIWERIGRRPNHLWDCWNMQIIAASMAGLIGEKIA